MCCKKNNGRNRSKKKCGCFKTFGGLRGVGNGIAIITLFVSLGLFISSVVVLILYGPPPNVPSCRSASMSIVSPDCRHIFGAICRDNEIILVCASLGIVTAVLLVIAAILIFKMFYMHSIKVFIITLILGLILFILPFCMRENEGYSKTLSESCTEIGANNSEFILDLMGASTSAPNGTTGNKKKRAISDDYPTIVENPNGGVAVGPSGIVRMGTEPPDITREKSRGALAYVDEYPGGQTQFHRMPEKVLCLSPRLPHMLNSALSFLIFSFFTLFISLFFLILLYVLLPFKGPLGGEEEGVDIEESNKTLANRDNNKGAGVGDGSDSNKIKLLGDSKRNNESPVNNDPYFYPAMTPYRGYNDGLLNQHSYNSGKDPMPIGPRIPPSDKYPLPRGRGSTY